MCDFDLRATHARTLLPAALASVTFEIIWVCISSSSSSSVTSSSWDCGTAT